MADEQADKEYSPNSNPTGKRPEFRTLAGISAAKRRLSGALTASLSAQKGALLGSGQSPGLLIGTANWDYLKALGEASVTPSNLGVGIEPLLTANSPRSTVEMNLAERDLLWRRRAANVSFQGAPGLSPAASQEGSDEASPPEKLHLQAAGYAYAGATPAQPVPQEPHSRGVGSPEPQLLAPGTPSGQRQPRVEGFGRPEHLSSAEKFPRSFSIKRSDSVESMPSAPGSGSHEGGVIPMTPLESMPASPEPLPKGRMLLLDDQPTPSSKFEDNRRVTMTGMEDSPRREPEAAAAGSRAGTLLQGQPVVGDIRRTRQGTWLWRTGVCLVQCLVLALALWSTREVSSCLPQPFAHHMPFRGMHASGASHYAPVWAEQLPQLTSMMGSSRASLERPSAHPPGGSQDLQKPGAPTLQPVQGLPAEAAEGGDGAGLAWPAGHLGAVEEKLGSRLELGSSLPGRAGGSREEAVESVGPSQSGTLAQQEQALGLSGETGRRPLASRLMEAMSIEPHGSGTGLAAQLWQRLESACGQAGPLLRRARDATFQPRPASLVSLLPGLAVLAAALAGLSTKLQRGWAEPAQPPASSECLPAVSCAASLPALHPVRMVQQPALSAPLMLRRAELSGSPLSRRAARGRATQSEQHVTSGVGVLEGAVTSPRAGRRRAGTASAAAVVISTPVRRSARLTAKA